MDLTIIWDLDDDEGGHALHIREHGLENDDLAHVLYYPAGKGISDSSRRPMVFGYTLDGRFVTIIVEQVDADTVYPITAFEVPGPRWDQIMAKQVTRDRKLTAEEAARYRRIREEEEIEMEKPQIIAKAQRARCRSRHEQLAAIMQELKAAREAKGLSLTDVFRQTGMDRSALSKLENATNDNPTIDTLLRYALDFLAKVTQHTCLPACRQAGPRQG